MASSQPGQAVAKPSASNSASVQLNARTESSELLQDHVTPDQQYTDHFTGAWNDQPSSPRRYPKRISMEDPKPSLDSEIESLKSDKFTTHAAVFSSPRDITQLAPRPAHSQTHVRENSTSTQRKPTSSSDQAELLYHAPGDKTSSTVFEQEKISRATAVAAQVDRVFK